MKSLKSILESIKPWGSHLVWNMKGAINDNYGDLEKYIMIRLGIH